MILCLSFKRTTNSRLLSNSAIFSVNRSLFIRRIPRTRKPHANKLWKRWGLLIILVIVILCLLVILRGREPPVDVDGLLTSMMMRYESYYPCWILTLSAFPNGAPPPPCLIGFPITHNFETGHTTPRKPATTCKSAISQDLSLSKPCIGTNYYLRTSSKTKKNHYQNNATI